MDNGFITIHRKMTKWGWYQKSEMVHLFLHLLLLANHEQGHWQGHTIERGQLITGLHSLKRDTGISTRTLRTCLNRLKTTGEITSKTTNKFRIITIVKYEDYQGKKEKTTSKTTIKLTSNRQATDKQPTTNNNVNNDNNIYSLALGIAFWNSFALWDMTNGFPRNSSVLNKLLPACRKETLDLISVWKKISPCEEDWKLSIKNYLIEIANRDPNNDYSNHRFSMFDFIKQKNGYQKFLNK